MDYLTKRSLDHSAWSFVKSMIDFSSNDCISRVLTFTVISGIYFSILFVFGFMSAPSVEVSDLAVKTASGFHYSWSEILLNNIRIGLATSVLGVLILPSMVIIGANGFEIGSTLGSVYSQYGVYTVLLVPHAIVEFPAIFFCAGAGFRMSVPVVVALLMTDKFKFSLRELVQFERFRFLCRIAIKDYFIMLFIGLLLFLIGSVIETTITLDLVYYVNDLQG